MQVGELLLSVQPSFLQQKKARLVHSGRLTARRFIVSDEAAVNAALEEEGICCHGKKIDVRGSQLATLGAAFAFPLGYSSRIESFGSQHAFTVFSGHTTCLMTLSYCGTARTAVINVTKKIEPRII